MYFAPSWVLVATFVTIAYSSLLRSLVDNLSAGPSYLAAFGFAVAFALCVLAHEAGHTAVSLALGRPVRRIVIFLLGGVSEVEGEVERPRDELLIAVAGPAVSGLIAGVAASVAVFLPHDKLPAVLLALLTWSNLVVAVFNLLPGLPLDGGRALRAIVWGASRSRRAGTLAAAWIGRVVAVLVALASVYAISERWGVFSFVTGLLLAVFIWSGAGRAVTSLRLAERVETLRIADLLRPGVLVTSDVSVAEAVRRAQGSAAQGIVIVDGAANPIAIVEEHRVRELPVERQPWWPIASVARPLEAGLVLSERADGSALVDALRTTPAGEYLVVREDGSLAGVLTARDVAIALGGGRQ